MWWFRENFYSDNWGLPLIEILITSSVYLHHKCFPKMVPYETNTCPHYFTLSFQSTLSFCLNHPLRWHRQNDSSEFLCPSASVMSELMVCKWIFKCPKESTIWKNPIRNQRILLKCKVLFSLLNWPEVGLPEGSKPPTEPLPSFWWFSWSFAGGGRDWEEAENLYLIFFFFSRRVGGRSKIVRSGGLIWVACFCQQSVKCVFQG